MPKRQCQYWEENELTRGIRFTGKTA